MPKEKHGFPQPSPPLLQYGAIRPPWGLTHHHVGLGASRPRLLWPFVWLWSCVLLLRRMTHSRCQTKDHSPRRVFGLRPQPRPTFYGYLTNTLWLSILRGAKTIITAGWARCAHGCGALCVWCVPLSFVVRHTPHTQTTAPVASSGFALSRARRFTAILPINHHKPNGKPSAWGLLGTLIAALASVLTMV